MTRGDRARRHLARRLQGVCANLDISVSRLARVPAVEALTINEAAETTGWSPRMLRYVERVGLVEPARSAGGYRLYGPAELQRLRTLRELTDGYGISLSDLAFAVRQRREPGAARAPPTRGWTRAPCARPTSPPPTGCARAGEAPAPARGTRTTPHPMTAEGDLMATPDLRTATDFKVADLSLAGVRPQGDPARRARDARPHGDPRASSPTRSRSRARASPARCT